MDRWERLPRASSPSWGLAIATDGAPDDSRLLALARRFLSGEAIDWAKEGVTESEVREGMKRLQALLGRPEPSESTETWAATPADAPTVSIGPYRLLRKLGEGGMGEVWLAEQAEPVRRRVALKVIRAGMDSRQVVARFEAERQALALMDHPAIAKVFDAGETPEGRSYFVMEYIQGVPITHHCDRHKLGNRERLELFVRVCEGVQHAHQKAVIHRDLKPSNVLVALQDGKAVPKIIDFGVAKATSQPLTTKTLFTELGALIGTPEYMSPEQAVTTGQDIDTRTDVYALGVMLYELLVGALPFGPGELRRAGIEGLLRMIREDEPPMPSVRLGTLGDESAESARRRGVDVPTLRSQLRGDLDWITMKALEKDRARRYASAGELAADVVKHMNDEPVAAGPPGVAYRVAKFVRRHRLGVGVTLVGSLGILTFAAVTAWQARRIARERDLAVREATRSERVIDVLVGALAQFDPRRGKKGPAAIDDLLERTGAHLETSLDDEPDVKARVLRILGVVHRLRGEWADARPLLESSIAISRSRHGDDDPQVLRTTEMLAYLEVEAGQLERAEALLQQVADARKRLLGSDHPDTVEAMRGLGYVRQKRSSSPETEQPSEK